MASIPPTTSGTPSRSIVLDVALQLGLLALLLYACARIVLPFAGILLWSVILTVMLHPLHVRLASKVGNRWSALLIGLVGVALILAPTVAVVSSIASSAGWLISGLQDHTLSIPPPPPRLGEAPVVGPKLVEVWTLVATDGSAAIIKYSKQLSTSAMWVAALSGRLVAGELSFVLSFAIAAVLVAYAKGAATFAQRLLEILTGNRGRGPRLAALTAATVRGVAIGVVGVAAIQSVLIGVGFFAIGLPAAGLLMLLALLLGIIQVPATLLTLPVIIYVFATEPTGPAVIFMIWSLFAGLSDNFLKPLMLGRGLEVPMPVILIGVIGGMIVDGLLGLFIGPVVLAVGYVLFMEWLDLHSVDKSAAESGDLPK